jgi:hypothetical protein
MVVGGLCRISGDGIGLLGTTRMKWTGDDHAVVIVVAEEFLR